MFKCKGYNHQLTITLFNDSTIVLTKAKNGKVPLT